MLKLVLSKTTHKKQLNLFIKWKKILKIVEKKTKF